MKYRETEHTLYSEVNYMSIDPKKLEGIVNAGTSTAKEQTDEVEGQGAVSLNNSPTPTPEEEEAAGVENIDEETPLAPEEGTEPGLEPEAEPEATPGEPEAPEAATEPDPTPEVEPEGVSETEATQPKFTQSQVDEIAGKVRKETREKVMRDIFGRYGVNSAEELDNLMGDAQRYGLARDEFTAKETEWKAADEARNQELVAVKEDVALLRSGIDQNRFEDARLILRGKGLEVTAENIAAELATHPEWKTQPAAMENAGIPFRKNPNPAPAPEQPGPATKIAIPTLGNNSADTPSPELSEREKALKMFKV